jgi:hypothetical protein
MSKTIVLNYKINGASFKRSYNQVDWRAAQQRANLLKQQGIPVVVKGWPKRINVPEFAS